MRGWKAAGAFTIALLGSAAACVAAPAAPAPAAGMALMGAGVVSTDLDRSLRFYTEGLGLTVARTIESADSTEVILAFGAEPRPPLLFLSRGKGKAATAPAAGTLRKIVLMVPDAAASAARLKAAGYAPGEVKTNSVNQGKLFWVKDPDGNAFEVIESPSRR